jgi:hypothetical protein
MSAGTGSGLLFLLPSSLGGGHFFFYGSSLRFTRVLLSNEPSSVSFHAMLLDVRAKERMKSARQLTKGSSALLLATYALLPREMLGMSKTK